MVESADTTKGRPRVLVTGAAGMLGGDVVRVLSASGARVEPSDLPTLDIRSHADCEAAVEGMDVVVNCAAYTAVDAAEEDEGTAFSVNAVGPANLAKACAEVGAVLVQLSTDYVFAGDAQEPYPEDSPLGPRSAYGRSKAAGEWAVRAHLPNRHYLVRTAWLYGRQGPSFVHTMRRLALQDDDPVMVVADQVGQPTWTRDVAGHIAALLEATAPFGVYHATSAGKTTWFDLARTVFTHVGADPDRVRAVSTSDYPRPAPRPAWSVLGHQAWTWADVPPIGHWQERLAAFAASGFGEG